MSKSLWKGSRGLLSFDSAGSAGDQEFDALSCPENVQLSRASSRSIDRILVAQAEIEDFTIFCAERAFAACDLQAIWAGSLQQRAHRSGKRPGPRRVSARLWLPPRAIAELFDLSCLHVVYIARGEHVVRLLPGLVQPGIIVYRYLPGSYDFEGISLHNDCGVFG